MYPLRAVARSRVSSNEARSAVGERTDRDERRTDVSRVEFRGEKPHVLQRVLTALHRRFRGFRLRSAMHSFGRGSYIDRPAWIVGARWIAIGDEVGIWRYARIEAFNGNPGEARVRIGQGTVIQPYVHIGAIQEVTIGRNCLFASHVYISDHDHDFSDPSIPPTQGGTLLAAPVRIGDNVWLGERVSVLKGVTIGDSSVVGAGSVVAKSVPPRTIVAGVPARVLRQWDPEARDWVRVR